jgi:hypothetical protein
VSRRAPPLGRGARIQYPQMLEPLDLRDVRVAVDDRAAVLEPGGEPGFAALARAWIVDHADLHVVHLDDALLRQNLLQSLLVHVSADADDGRAELLQLLQDLRRDEISGMQQEIGSRDQPYALIGQRTRPAWEMGVGDDRDAGQEAVTGSGATTLGSRRKCPAFQMSSPSA